MIRHTQLLVDMIDVTRKMKSIGSEKIMALVLVQSGSFVVYLNHVSHSCESLDIASVVSFNCRQPAWLLALTACSTQMRWESQVGMPFDFSKPCYAICNPILARLCRGIIQGQSVSVHEHHAQRQRNKFVIPQSIPHTFHSWSRSIS